MKDKATKAPKTNTTREKKVPVKWVKRKRFKASVLISKLIKYLVSDIQAHLMTINIVILALYLFQISPKFKKRYSAL